MAKIVAGLVVGDQYVLKAPEKIDFPFRPITLVTVLRLNYTSIPNCW